MSNAAAETYLAIASRAQDPENYPAVQIESDLHSLLHATADLIRDNAALKAQVLSGDKYVESLEFKIFEKDLELFNAINQLDNPEGGLAVV